MQIGINRIGEHAGGMYVIAQIGVSRIGTVRAIARNILGRFVAVWKLVEIKRETTETVKIANPVKRSAPLARAVVALTALVIGFKAAYSFFVRVKRALCVMLAGVVGRFALDSVTIGHVTTNVCRGR